MEGRLVISETATPNLINRITHVHLPRLLERLYFQRVIVPGMNNYNGDLVKVLRPKWLPVTGPVQTDLLAVVRNELRPVPIEHRPPKDAAQNRLDFGAAIEHRPGRGTGIGR